LLAMVKNRILVVTGMHRSGTSLITQWLSKCGLHVGDELMGAETGNDEGHFEDVDFLKAHQSILKGRRITDEGYTDPIKLLPHEEKDILNDIISYKNNFNQQWGWKDPRTCLFLDTYRQLIPDAFYFVVLRDYQSVVSSLILRIYNRTVKKYSSRRGLSKFIWEHIKKKRRMNMLLRKHSQRYLKVWIAYNEAILQHLAQLSPENYLVTDYTILYDNDRAVFGHLTHDWGFSLDFFNFKNIYKNNMLHKAVDINGYIKDKSLLSRAAGIEASLKQLSVFNNQQHALLAV
jgi:hypothetical protein